MTGAKALVSYKQALTLLRDYAVAYRRVHPAVIEERAILDALNCVLAEDVVSPETHPRLNCSAMDGFAFNSRSLIGLPENQTFPVLGLIAAGDGQINNLNLVESPGIWEIMTGAPLPNTCDTVSRIEDCRVERDATGRAITVQFNSPVSPGRNVRLAGEDFAPGPVYLRRGQQLRAEDLLCLASMGVLKVRVKKPLRVGYIATGRELTALNETPKDDQIRNSSAVYLELQLKRFGVEFENLGLVADDPQHFLQIIKDAQKRSVRDQIDILVSTGAISMGQFDFIGASLEEVGSRFLFRKVAVKPAKPILFAEIPGSLRPMMYFGLPGQPISTLVGVRFFLEPFLSDLSGSITKPSPCYLLPLARSLRKQSGVTSFLRGSITQSNGRSEIDIHPIQQPSRLMPLLESNAWVKLDETGEECLAGDRVEVYPF